MRTQRLLPTLACAITLLTSAWLGSAPALAADDVRSWRWQDPDKTVNITLRQRRPDAVRAFFTARGFSATDADAIARECIFLVGVTNPIDTPGSGTLDIDLSQWRQDSGDGPRPLYLKERWLAHWAQSDAPDSARAAFYWSMYHTHQHLQPGERMFGMISLGLPAATRFRLDFSWRRGDSTEQGSLTDLQCAPDPSNPETKE